MTDAKIVGSKLSVQKMRNFINGIDYEELRKEQFKNMTRAERREFERKEEKLKKCVNNMTPIQLEMIQHLSDMKASEIADEKIEEFKDNLDRCMTALLILSLPDKSWKEIDGLIDLLAELVHEDVTKILEFKKECKGDQEIMNKTMQKYESEVKAKGLELIEKGVKQKEAIDILTSQFPMLSKSMLTNAYKRLKSEWDEQRPKEEVVAPDVKDAMGKIEKIIEDKEEKKTSDQIIQKAEEYLEKVEKEEPKVVCNGNSCSIVENEVSKEFKEEVKVMNEEKKQLKVLSMTLQGENGTYKVCPEGVELQNSDQIISFTSESELNKWVGEFRQVFAMMG